MDAKELMEIQAIENMSENRRRHDRGWGMTTAVWVIAGVIVFGFVAWLWSKGCTEKTEIAVGLANVAGRVGAMETAVTSQGNNIYKINGVLSAAVQGTGDLKECVNDKLDFLEGQILFQGNRRSGCGCGCGNREFRQSSTYNLASTQVTVDETCRN